MSLKKTIDNEKANLVYLKEYEKNMTDRVTELNNDLQNVDFIPTYIA